MHKSSYCVTLFCNIILLMVNSANSGINNVCTTYRAYENIQNNKHCFHNPDLSSTPFKIASRYGYILDNHQATTKDGYIVSIFRINKKDNAVKFGQPVILQHGILVDGLSWMLSGNNSLAFNMVANGFDVWMPSFRGTRFSKKHINVTISEKEYWNFSFHEMGIYDLPAIIEKVSEITKRNDIVYIGHSMGSTSALVYTSIRPEHAKQHIKGFIYLAPVAFFNNPRGAIKAVLPFYMLLKKLLDDLQIRSIGTIPVLQNLITQTCGQFPLILICQIVYSFATGLVVEQIRPELFPLTLRYYPTGTAVKTLAHFAQIASGNQRFQWYDYGQEDNSKIYNSSIPPTYDIKNNQVPTHIFASPQDFLSDMQDARTIYNQLTCSTGFHTYELAHTDYLYGKSINQLYEDIADVINTFTPNCNIIK